MNILSLDCEYNQPSGKTIQIGATVYTVNGILIERFETYVDPGEPINPEITTLTGITDGNVKGAPSIKEAYEMLEYIHSKHKCFRNPLVWGSGVRNDSQMIHTESGVERENFMGYRVIDVKSIYQSVQMFTNQTVRGGLETACKRVGIGFEGKAHTALADAMNTYRMWQYLMKKLK